jgi:hypothetical protein
MSLTDHLHALADRLGLIRIVQPRTKPAAPELATRTLSLRELTAKIRAEEVRALAEMPAEMSVELEKVFEAAGISAPDHGWTVQRLKELLRSEQFRSMDRKEAQAAVAEALAADEAPAKDIIEEAVARDEALDAYEQVVRRKMDQRHGARQQQIEQVTNQIHALQEEADRLAEQLRLDQEHWQQWQQRKHEVEDELAWALGYLVEDPIITRGPSSEPK